MQNEVVIAKHNAARVKSEELGIQFEVWTEMKLFGHVYNKKNMDSTLDPELLARLQKMRKEKEEEDGTGAVSRSSARQHTPLLHCNYELCFHLASDCPRRACGHGSWSRPAQPWSCPACVEHRVIAGCALTRRPSQYERHQQAGQGRTILRHPLSACMKHRNAQHPNECRADVHASGCVRCF